MGKSCRCVSTHLELPRNHAGDLVLDGLRLEISLEHEALNGKSVVSIEGTDLLLRPCCSSLFHRSLSCWEIDAAYQKATHLVSLWERVNDPQPCQPYQPYRSLC